LGQEQVRAERPRNPVENRPVSIEEFMAFVRIEMST
jgi:hypothetical protein